ncbi:MAG: hypothetical protein LBU27_06000 [Candidatus Peribacteria bacterium]|jgi:hypothetical protein|nr:hypothetical protein [Candidatus Peribacteria bacterium]
MTGKLTIEGVTFGELFKGGGNDDKYPNHYDKTSYLEKNGNTLDEG